MLYYNSQLSPAPVQEQTCCYCGNVIDAQTWARTGKMWKTANQINVYWFHAGCPVQFKAFSPFRKV